MIDKICAAMEMEEEQASCCRQQHPNEKQSTQADLETRQLVQAGLLVPGNNDVLDERPGGSKLLSTMPDKCYQAPG